MTLRLLTAARSKTTVRAVLRAGLLPTVWVLLAAGASAAGCGSPAEVDGLFDETTGGSNEDASGGTNDTGNNTANTNNNANNNTSNGMSDASVDASLPAKDGGADGGADAEPPPPKKCDTLADCEDDNPCTTETCVPEIGCMYANVAADTSVGLCAVCDGDGNMEMPADDGDCDAFVCSGYYTKQGTPESEERCYAASNITSDRCIDVGVCKTQADCSSQPPLGSPTHTCAVCQQMSGCTGMVNGSCTNRKLGELAAGETCGVGECERQGQCDGNGGVMCNPGTDTGNDTDCDGLDDNCNGEDDENYIPTCLGVCVIGAMCVDGVETCGTPQVSDVPDDSGTDTNCDGIDGVAADGIFVSTSGADTASCGTSKTNTCASVSYGIQRAVEEGRSSVFVQAGVYNGVVVLQTNVSVYGGYDSNWERDNRTIAGHTVELHGGLDNGTGGDSQYLTVRAHAVSNVTLSQLKIYGPDASERLNGNGKSSYGIHAVSASLIVHGVDVIAGDGADGANGSTGASPADVEGVEVQNGVKGDNGYQGAKSSPTASCDTVQEGGGAAGTNSVCSTANGGDGGDGGQMDDCCNGSTCSGCGCGSTTGSNGSSAATFMTSSYGYRGGGGAICTEGGPGADGTVSNGPGGSGASDGGFLSSYYWYGHPGYEGELGQHGTGGGGGGGAGGCSETAGANVRGGGGGGGGAGGCRATSGGTGGGGGGGSFGIFLANSSSVNLSQCSIQQGAGGDGGDGGRGGRGQEGGIGADGGDGTGTNDDDSGPGGAGGDGAHGGHSGGGGGGAGGDSYAYFSYTSTITGSCTVSGGQAGAGGSGGPKATSSHNDGFAGSAGVAGTKGTSKSCASQSAC